MSRALYKLSKAFSDQPAPRNVADRVRRQIEKFKSYQALLNVICNPGIRDRHWKKVALLGSSWLFSLKCHRETERQKEPPQNYQSYSLISSKG